jgi:hypothetical protein
MHYFSPGDRVRIRAHYGWPDGITGTVVMPDEFLLELCEPGEWDGCQRTMKSEKGWHVSYYVEFDEPHDDGSGHGPYQGSEVLVEYLEALRGQ